MLGRSLSGVFGVVASLGAIELERGEGWFGEFFVTGVFAVFLLSDIIVMSAKFTVLPSEAVRRVPGGQYVIPIALCTPEMSRF